jgi:organic radical activating enzyme
MTRTAVVSLFATCTMKCGYCDLAESGQVLDGRQLKPYHDKNFIFRATDFFNKRTTDENKWLLIFTGGEPLLAPNIDLLCANLFEAGNRVAFYTGLHVGPNSAGWKLLLNTSYPQVDYVMAAFHPEAEQWEDIFFDRIRALKDRGHKVFFRFVAHPKRLHRLDELAEKCQKLDICFFPAALLTDNYPRAYTQEERSHLQEHSNSLTQFIHLEGGIDTTSTTCHASNKIIGVHLLSGEITPCITVDGPVIGNIHKDELNLESGPIRCPNAGVNCVCEIHYEQDIVIGAEDSKSFTQRKEGFVDAIKEQDPLKTIRAKGIQFYVNPQSGMAKNISDEQQLVFSDEYVKSSFRRNVLGIADASDNKITSTTNID